MQSSAISDRSWNDTLAFCQFTWFVVQRQSVLKLAKNYFSHPLEKSGVTVIVKQHTYYCFKTYCLHSPKPDFYVSVVVLLNFVEDFGLLICDHFIILQKLSLLSKLSLYFKHTLHVSSQAVSSIQNILFCVCNVCNMFSFTLLLTSSFWVSLFKNLNQPIDEVQFNARTISIAGCAFCKLTPLFSSSSFANS